MFTIERTTHGSEHGSVVLEPAGLICVTDPSRNGTEQKNKIMVACCGKFVIDEKFFHGLVSRKREVT